MTEYFAANNLSPLKIVVMLIEGFGKVVSGKRQIDLQTYQKAPYTLGISQTEIVDNNIK